MILKTLVLLALLASPQDDDPFGIPGEGLEVELTSTSVEPAEAKIGEVVHVRLGVQVKEGWHYYSLTADPESTIPAFFEIDKGGPAEAAGDLIEPKPKSWDFFGTVYPVHEGSFEISLPVRLTGEAKEGEVTLSGRLGGQVCEEVCLNVDLPFQVVINVLPGGTAVPAQIEPETPSAEKKPPEQSEEAKELLEKGFLGFLLACVMGGLISLIMPCVYPLIPITLTFFVKQSGGTKARSAGLAFMYGLGIIVTFTGLGFLLSKVIGAVGARVFAGDPWVNLVIAGVFLILAVSLLGMFELKLPGFITNKAAGSSPKQGFAGAFGLGLIFAVVTFTCTIPVAGGLLSLAAGGGSPGWALSGMLVYSITMAFPFILLGLFPELLQKIPRSGGWLQTVKVGAGFLELALVFYYLAKADFGFFGIDGFIMSREMVLAIWVAIMMATTLWLLGMWRFSKDPETKGIGYGRGFWAFLTGVFTFWLATGLAGNHLGGFETVLPISNDLHRPMRVETDLARIKTLIKEGGTEQVSDIKEEYLDYDEALKAAKHHSKAVFIDFTGFT